MKAVKPDGIKIIIDSKKDLTKIFCFHCNFEITNSIKCLHDCHDALLGAIYKKEKEVWLCGDCDKKVWNTRFEEATAANKESREFKKDYEKNFNSLREISKEYYNITNNKFYKILHKINIL